MMKLIMEIKVTLFPAEIVEGECEKIVMIPFSAETEGELFSGKTLINGIDTQHIFPDGSMRLSARYVLHGKDSAGDQCSIFIENSGASPESCTPVICTDSPKLRFLESTPLSSKVETSDENVIVRIFG